MSNDVPATATATAPKHGVILRNVMHLGLGQIVSTALGFVFTATLARTLGPSEFGLYVVVTTIVGFVFVLIDWGQATYLIAQIAVGRADEPRFIGAALAVRAVGALCAMFLAAIIARSFGYADSVAVLAPFMVALSIPAYLGQAIGYVFRGKDRMGVDTFTANVGKAAGLVGALLALFCGGGLFEVIGASAVGGLGWLAATAFYARRLGVHVASPNRSGIEEQVRLGLPIAASAFVFSIHPLIEVWILSRFSGPEVIGWFGAAKVIAGLFVIPAGILAGASFPEVARAAKSVADLRRVLGINARIILLVSAFAASFVFLLADYFVIIIYGRGQFEKTTQLVRVAMLFLPLLSVGFLLGNATAVIGRMREVAAAKVVFILATSAFAWFSIGYFQAKFGNGAMAIQLAAGVGELWMLLCFAYLLPRGVVTWKMFFDVLRALCAMILTLVPLWALQPMPVWLLAPLCVIVFAVVAWGLRLVTKSDAEKFSHLLFGRVLTLRAPPG
jgi:O-antigen/teichoic acid export membrane protein